MHDVSGLQHVTELPQHLYLSLLFLVHIDIYFFILNYTANIALFCDRREEREPGKHARVCSCHFRDGNKSNGPEIFKRNRDKLFPAPKDKPKKKKSFQQTRSLYKK